MRNNFRLFVFIFLYLFFSCLFINKLNAELELPFSNPENPERLISMDFKDASLNDVLKAFSQESGLNFIASEAVEDRKITLYFENVPVKDAMDKIFKANNLSYELDKDAKIFIVKDWGKPEMETITKIFYLKHRSVPSAKLQTEQTALLKKFRRAEQGETEQVKEETREEKLGIISSIKQALSSVGKITEDTKTNSLIITDIPSRFPIIEQVIAKLDIPVSQVLIDVEMLDVNKNIVDKLGFDFGQTPFTAVLTGATAVTGFPFQSWSKTFSPTNGTIAINSANAYQVQLDFLKTQTDTKYLARPRLLTLNNETAEITITKDEVAEVIVITEPYTPSGGGTPITLIKGYEFIRASGLRSGLLPKGVGITLRVTPQINPDTNEITMVINPQASTSTESARAKKYIIPGSAPNAYYSVAEPEIRETKSIVKVKDGETVILGGLIHTDKQVTTKSLPILSDIPFLGALFRHKDVTVDTERELIVFITPHIIKDKTIELAQTKKVALPEREQNTASGISRHAIIEASLNSFNTKK